MKQKYQFLKVIVFNFILITSMLSTSLYASINPSSIRVWSFNMEGWSHQHPMQAAYTNFLNQNKIAEDTNIPDFIATQENFGNTQSDFIRALNALKPPVLFEQYGRARGGANSPAETNSIIYNKTRWMLISQYPTIENNLSVIANLRCDKYTSLNSLTCQLITGHDNYARIITWGIFQEIANPNNIVILTSTHNALNTLQDQANQQQQVASIVNKLVQQVGIFYPNITPTVVMAGDYNTTSFKVLLDNVDTLVDKTGKPAAWGVYSQQPDSILDNAMNSAQINYHPGETITDHGPIAETVTLIPNALTPRK